MEDNFNKEKTLPMIPKAVLSWAKGEGLCKLSGTRKKLVKITTEITQLFNEISRSKMIDE